jgi:hypothetical protein
MRQAMHLHWAARFTDKGALDWQHIAAAVECAAKVAPYEHPRLIASAVTVRRPDEMSDDELLSSIDIAEAHAEALERGEDVCGGVPGGADETRH